MHEALGAAGAVDTVSAGGRPRRRALPMQVYANVIPAPPRRAAVTPAPPCSW
ncbi:MAG: hypothetical protein QOE72_156 [Chloroflexota bacterium]|jgi:hypothetical protein|nr:hypothetical protein [Chloroflexota bacterium]